MMKVVFASTRNREIHPRSRTCCCGELLTSATKVFLRTDMARAFHWFAGTTLGSRWRCHPASGKIRHLVGVVPTRVYRGIPVSGGPLRGVFPRHRVTQLYMEDAILFFLHVDRSFSCLSLIHISEPTRLLS